MTLLEDAVNAFARDIATLAPFILVVDDDKEFRHRIAQTLRKDGFNVIEANSGDTAVHLCETARPGGVLMDYRFTRGFNGSQAIDEIANRHPDHGSPISAVIVTEYPDDVKDLRYPVVRKQDLAGEHTQGLERIRQKFFIAIKEQVARMVSEHLQSIPDRLAQYEARFGRIENYATPIVRYEARVVDARPPNSPDGVLIEFELPDGTKQGRLLPRERLASIKAAFRGARILYEIYENGPVSLSNAARIGKGLDDLTEDDFEPMPEKALQSPT